MAQVPHVDVGGTPVDLTDGLDPGCYIAQPRRFPSEVGVEYATAETAPAEDDDWFYCHGGQAFTFTVAESLPPTWARALWPSAGDVAIAMARDPQ